MLGLQQVLPARPLGQRGIPQPGERHPCPQVSLLSGKLLYDHALKLGLIRVAAIA